MPGLPVGAVEAGVSSARKDKPTKIATSFHFNHGCETMGRRESARWVPCAGSLKFPVSWSDLTRSRTSYRSQYNEFHSRPECSGKDTLPDGEDHELPLHRQQPEMEIRATSSATVSAVQHFADYKTVHGRLIGNVAPAYYEGHSKELLGRCMEHCILR